MLSNWGEKLQTLKCDKKDDPRVTSFPHLLTLTERKKWNPKAMISYRRPTTIGQKIYKLNWKAPCFNTLASGCFWGFSEKKRLNAHGFAQEFLQSGMLYRPGKSLKRRGKSSLHLKKNFLLERCAGFCEWRHKWRTFRPPWPTLPGPERQPLGGSISLKFLLETRLQSESFDTLDDLLGFRVQKLWCKLVKIFD